MASLITIDSGKCAKCGNCAAICPTNVIGFKKGAVPFAVAWADKACIRCGHCVAACPKAALTHQDVPLEKCTRILKDLAVSREQVEQFFKSRRSIRKYRDEPVDQKAVRELIELANYAPTGHNSLSVAWKVIMGKEQIRALSDGVVEWMMKCVDEGAPIATALSMKGILMLLKTSPEMILRGAPCLVLAHAKADDRMAPPSATIALAHLELAARAFGLGACWAGFLELGFTNYEPLRRKFNLPEGHVPLKAMMLGKPVYEYHRIPVRKPPVITM